MEARLGRDIRPFFGLDIWNFKVPSNESPQWMKLKMDPFFFLALQLIEISAFKIKKAREFFFDTSFLPCEISKLLF